MGWAQSRAGSGRTNTVQAQGIQELGPLQLCPQGHHIQLWGCIWRRWGPRDWPFPAHPWEKAVDKVQLGPAEEVGEGILEGSRGQWGWRGQRVSTCWQWEMLPVHLQGVWAGGGVSSELGTASARGVNTGGEQDPSS